MSKCPFTECRTQTESDNNVTQTKLNTMNTKVRVSEFDLQIVHERVRQFFVIAV